MNAPTTAKGKTKPNLTSVTVSPPPPESPEMDTTTPIDITVLPFTQREMPKWGAWMLYRLSEIWPRFAPINYVGLLMQHMSTNSSLFIHTRKSILLAVVTHETFEPRPIVDVVFCFKHHPGEQQEDKDVRLLFRRMDDWARSLGARYVRTFHHERIDCDLTRIREMMWADDGKYFLRDLDK